MKRLKLSPKADALIMSLCELCRFDTGLDVLELLREGSEEGSAILPMIADMTEYLKEQKGLELIRICDSVKAAE